MGYEECKEIRNMMEIWFKVGFLRICRENKISNGTKNVGNGTTFLSNLTNSIR